MGNFNIDLLETNNHVETESFLDFMFKHSMQPHILGPTRIDERNKYTLIDNIFYNEINDVCHSGNLLCPITDHLPNFLIIASPPQGA